MNGKNLLTFGLMTAALAFTGCSDDDDDNGSGCGGHDICLPDADVNAPDADLITPITRTSVFVDAVDEAHDEIAGSSVTLVLDPVAETATAKDWVAKGLVPGDVVTVWWVFFTDITDCEAGVAGAKCGAPDLSGDAVDTIIPGFGYAGPAPMGGAIVDANGDATFPELTSPVVDAAAVNADFLIGNGLRDLNTTEIHLVLRTHGQALGGALEETQLGTFNGGCLEGEPNEGECANIQFAFFNPLQ